jgi:hypothetical protein
VDLVTLVSAGRVALGVSTFLAPGPALRPVGIDASSDPQLAYLSRIAGSRDVVLGLLPLVAPADARRALLAAGLAVDAADAVAGVVARRSGGLGARSAVALTALPLGSVVVLARHLARLRRSSPSRTASDR